MKPSSADMQGGHPGLQRYIQLGESCEGTITIIITGLHKGQSILLLGKILTKKVKVGFRVAMASQPLGK